MAELPAYDIKVSVGGVYHASAFGSRCPRDVVEALTRRAAEHGRNAEAEHRFILEEALCAGRAGFWQRAAALREETRGHISVPSEELIRQDRDER